MSLEMKDFYGKDVASAIKEACDTFGVAQENLNIEVVETGSTGIFGLIRKKAHIRASVQMVEEEAAGEERAKPLNKSQKAPKPKSGGTKEMKKAVPKKKEEPKQSVPPEPDVEEEKTDDDENGFEEDGFDGVELSQESLDLVKRELEKILELMGCPSEVSVENKGGSVFCKVGPEYEDDLTGQDGRTLDSLQYLLRKIMSRKVPERIRLTIDVGNYRERRHQELHDKAIDYAALVKQNGKTQVIPALNPSERRVVHVALQEDSEIRSRSVGEGLFKKVLIYKPGKGRKGNGRKKTRGKYRKKNDSGQKKGKQS